MRFLDSTAIAEWCASYGIQLDASGRLLPDSRLSNTTSAVYAESGTSGREFVIAAASLAALGDFDACLLWIEAWGVWPSSEDWPSFYAARGVHGERQALDRTPGHLFEPGEAGVLLEFVTLVLQNAWDARVLPILGGTPTSRLRCSHDGFVELMSSEPTEIVWAV